MVKNMMKFGSATALVTCLCCLGVACGQDLAALGDLSMLGDCALPDGYQVVSVADLAGCELDGTHVMIRHTVTRGGYRCTSMACIGTECCNCCDSRFIMDDESIDFRLTLQDYSSKVDFGCEGNDCELFCYGMEQEIDYVAWGTYKCDSMNDGTHIDRDLEVDGFCKLADSQTPDERYSRANYCKTILAM